MSPLVASGCKSASSASAISLGSPHHLDKGYRGHNHPHRLGVWISGQVRRVTASIRREMKRRAAVEPVIGHVKTEHRMDRNHLKGRLGDRIYAVLAAVGYNFGLLLQWLAEFLRVIIRAFRNCPGSQDRLNQLSSAFFTEDSFIWSRATATRRRQKDLP
ncbi:hypothetical protein XI09_04160 [Bradyrhizobium sp. CCBAU 11386]|nr:hypothetical protein [Bradyrhizobium sp. CCBAU 11386]